MPGQIWGMTHIFNYCRTMKLTLSRLEFDPNTTNFHLGTNSTLTTEQTSFHHATLSNAYSGRTCYSIMSW